MSAISAALIKELRETSGAGMMDCKKALTETDGDLEQAIDWLRKKGLAAAAKKSGRATSEGLIAVVTEGGKGAVVEVNSETDFVARNEQFQQLVEGIGRVALNAGADIDAINAASFPGTGRTVAEEISNAIGVIGENMQLRRAATIAVQPGAVVSYVHNAVKPGLGKIGVIVALESEAPAATLEPLGKQLAMHIAASKPEALNVDSLDPASIERERAVLKEQALASGKPESIVEKMLEGRIRKFYEEVVLLEQPFVMDGKTRVKEVIEQAAKEAGKPITLAAYAFLVLGEGVEKEESDFAAEVAAAAGAA